MTIGSINSSQPLLPHQTLFRLIHNILVISQYFSFRHDSSNRSDSGSKLLTKCSPFSYKLPWCSNSILSPLRSCSFPWLFQVKSTTLVYIIFLNGIEMINIVKFSGDHKFSKIAPKILLLVCTKYHLPVISYFQTKFVSNDINIMKMLKMSNTYILEMTL